MEKRTETINANNIRQLINLSEMLVKLAQSYALTADDERSLRFLGIVLDNAYKLRLEARKLSIDDKEIN
ncbi:MAG: hypothetical protein KQH63_15120 [Desulfobulbaceae bacterium]|nr:hypothetical protein [Desulfobulbaceae bacterium]